MKKGRGVTLAVTTLILLVLLVGSFQKLPHHARSSAAANKQLPNPAVPPSRPAAPIKIADIPEKIREEAKRSGQVDENSKETSDRLDQMAQGLKGAEIQLLNQVVKDPHADGDLRATSVELLARTKKEESLTALEDITATPWSQQTDPRTQAFEKALRARAIEGIENHPSQTATASLEKVIAQTQDRFLKDHAQRALLFRKGQVSSVEQQDEQALKKLITN